MLLGKDKDFYKISFTKSAHEHNYYASSKNSTSDFHGGKLALDTGIVGTSLNFFLKKMIYYLHIQFEVLLLTDRQHIENSKNAMFKSVSDWAFFLLILDIPLYWPPKF